MHLRNLQEGNRPQRAEDEKRIHIADWKRCIVHPDHLFRLRARSQERAFLGWKSNPSMEFAKSWPPLDIAAVPNMNISPQYVARSSISVPDALNQLFNFYGGGQRLLLRYLEKCQVGTVPWRE